MTEYIGNHISQLLEKDPFRCWPVEKSIEEDLDEPITCYVFNAHGLEVECDRDDKICVIFLYPEELGGFDESLFEIPFSSTRSQVRKRLSIPSKTGNKLTDPVLGKLGAWDRFTLPNFTIHIQYEYDADRISLITLMRNDVVPA